MDWTTGSITFLSSLIAIPGLGLVFKHWITERLTHSIKHEYDSKLVKLESELNSHRERLTAINTGALSIVSHQNQLIVTKRFESIEKIWKATVSLSGPKAAAKTMQAVNFDFVSEKSQSSEPIRKMFEMINKGLNIDTKSANADDTATCRLYVNSETWATFAAYKQVLIFAVIKMKTIELGMNAAALIKHDEIASMVKAVLPHQEKFIDDHGMKSLDFLVEEIETKLFRQLQDELHGTSTGKEGADRASTILQHASKTQIYAAAQQAGALGTLTGISER